MKKWYLETVNDDNRAKYVANITFSNLKGQEPNENVFRFENEKDAKLIARVIDKQYGFDIWKMVNVVEEETKVEQVKKPTKTRKPPQAKQAEAKPEKKLAKPIKVEILSDDDEQQDVEEVYDDQDADSTYSMLPDDIEDIEEDFSVPFKAGKR